MRSLILLIFSSTLMAAPASFQVNSNVTSSSGTTLINPDRTEDLANRTFSVLGNTGDTLGQLSFNIGATNRKVDYTNYTVRAADGSTTSLGDRFNKSETLFSLGTSYNIGLVVISVDGQSMVSDSPFKENNFNSGISFSNYSTGSNLNFNWFHRQSKRPVSYINNPDNFKSVRLSDRLTQNEFSLEYEQILSERVKIKIKPSYSLETMDRPASYGGEFFAGLAIFDEVAVLGNLSAYQEVDSGESPTIGTGFYSLRSGGLGVSVEPAYNLFLKAIYNITYEDETARGRNPSQKIGTDSYLLKSLYRLKKMEFNLSTQVDRSNTGYKSESISGGLTWNL